MGKYNNNKKELQLPKKKVTGTKCRTKTSFDNSFPILQIKKRSPKLSRNQHQRDPRKCTLSQRKSKPSFSAS